MDTFPRKLPPCAWKLRDLLPHRAPMVFLDSIEGFDPDARILASRAAINRTKPFYSGGGVPGWAAIEYMAQAAACLASAIDKSKGLPAPVAGLLLGTRKLDIASLPAFDAGKTYRIAAHNDYDDESGAAAFACTISDADGDPDAAPLASATLTAYRLPDPPAQARGEAQQ